MFDETIVRDGEIFKRFQYVGKSSDNEADLK